MEDRLRPAAQSLISRVALLFHSFCLVRAWQSSWQSRAASALIWAFPKPERSAHAGATAMRLGAAWRHCAYLPPAARLLGREKLTGTASLLRYAARCGAGQELYGTNPLDARLVSCAFCVPVFRTPCSSAATPNLRNCPFRRPAPPAAASWISGWTTRAPAS